MTRHIRLGINIDHVATLRQARRIDEPDPVHAAVVAEQAGADQITVHLREDRRHIQERDVRLIRQSIHIPLNLEMAATEEMLRFALEVEPHWVCFVPEKREEITTEGGLEVAGRKEQLAPVIRILQEAGVKVSLFIDPDLAQVKESRRCGADAVEFHTGTFAHAWGTNRAHQYLSQLAEACRAANRLGLGVHAGHGLNTRNLRSLLVIPEIEEVNIGHSIIGRAVFVGLKAAIDETRKILDSA